MRLKCVYFVHDTGDAAVRRRVGMLRAGGAEVRIAGFRRSDAPPPDIEGVRPVDLGRTRDGRLAHRALSVGRGFAQIPKLGALFDGADVVIARNLEMLALALPARDRFAPGAPLVYECLDIHRLMLADHPAGAALRALERRYLSACSLLIVSSQAFLEHYFHPRGQLRDTPALLLENKAFGVAGAPQARLPAGPPWRIGWFGALRCRRSFELLKRLAADFDGLLKVRLRGRPSPAVFPNFEAEVEAAPHVEWGGPYRNPEDLSAVYEETHFVWAIDYYEAGLNSCWLLPNRLYEGGLSGVVPLALVEVETGRWLAERGVGVRLREPIETELSSLLRRLTPEAYATLRADMEARPVSDWLCDESDCRALVARLGGLAARAERAAA